MAQKAYLFKDSLADAMLEFANFPSADNVNPELISFNTTNEVTSIDVTKVLYDTFNVDQSLPEEEKITLLKLKVSEIFDKYKDIATQETVRFRLKHGDPEVNDSVTSLALVLRAILDSNDSDAYSILIYLILTGLNKIAQKD